MLQLGNAKVGLLPPWGNSSKLSNLLTTLRPNETRKVRDSSPVLRNSIFLILKLKNWMWHYSAKLKHCAKLLVSGQLCQATCVRLFAKLLVSGQLYQGRCARLVVPCCLYGIAKFVHQTDVKGHLCPKDFSPRTLLSKVQKCSWLFIPGVPKKSIPKIKVFYKKSWSEIKLQQF